VLAPQLTASGTGLAAAELSQLISDQLKASFVYVSSDAQEALTVDIKQLSASDLRKVLSKRGAVVIARRESLQGIDRAALLSTRFTLSAESAETGTIAEALQRISIGRIELAPRDSRTRLSLDVKDVDLAMLAKMLSGVGETRIGFGEK
jgi:hypothetical protein